MYRLTKLTNTGGTGLVECEELTCGEICGEMLERGGCNNCCINRALEKLRRYEETGLEPQDIESLKYLESEGQETHKQSKFTDEDFARWQKNGKVDV